MSPHDPTDCWLAANPHVDPTQLQALAASHPHLRPVIARNPQAYDALLQWLGSLGDPEIDAALARRASEGPDFAPPVHPAAPVEESTMDGPPIQGSSTLGRPTATATPGHAPGQPYQPVYEGVPAYASAQQRPPAGNSSGKRILVIVLIVVLLAALAIFAASRLLGGVRKTPAEAASSIAAEESPGTSSDTTSPDESSSVGDSATESDAPYFVPSGALQLGGFQTQSGNTMCTVSDTSVTCLVVEHEAPIGDVATGTPALVTLDSSSGAVDVAPARGQQSLAETSTTLDFGQSVASPDGRFVCQSEEYGTMCWNSETGDGFAVSRSTGIEDHTPVRVN